MEHYRCVKCYFPQKKATRDVDTVTFFPTSVPFPKVNLDDFLRQAASDIVSLLQHPPSTTTPSLQAGDSIQNALLQLATILNRNDKLPSPILQTPSILHSPPRVLTSKPASKSPRVDETINATAPTSKPASTSPRVDETIIATAPTVKQKWTQQPVTQSRYNLRSTCNFKGTNFKNIAARTLLAQHMFSHPTINHIYDESGTRMSLKQLINGKNKHIWDKAMSMEIGRLAQGNDYGVTATDTIDFIPYALVPNWHM